MKTKTSKKAKPAGPVLAWGIRLSNGSLLRAAFTNKKLADDQLAWKLEKVVRVEVREVGK